MDEKTKVKKALKSPLVLDKVWQPIATAWFDKWKAYVNFDAVAGVKTVKDRYPGPVDNSPLRGSFGDELRRDLKAGRDFILLPQESADLLLKRYVPQGLTFQRRYFASGIKLQQAVTDVKSLLFGLFRIDKSTPTRYWLRETPPTPDATTATGMGRRLTNDIVEWDGDWHVNQRAMSRRLKDIRGDGDCVDLIIEVAPFRNPKPSDWPRFHRLEAWKQGLRLGDMIDACDAHDQFDFAAATVVHVHADGDLKVRYWTSGGDEWILASDLGRCIAPLHSHSRATSVPATVDMAPPTKLVTRKRPCEWPPAASNDDAGGGEKDHGAEQ
eukprot:gene18772-13527_t